MNARHLAIGLFAAAGIAGAFYALKPRQDLAEQTSQSSEPKEIKARSSAANDNTTYLDEKVKELQKENDELRQKAYAAEAAGAAQKNEPQTEPAEKSPGEVASAIASAARDMDMSPRGDGPTVPGAKPMNTTAKAYNMAVESQLRSSGNSEEEDKTLLKKAVLKNPSSTIASSVRAPEDRIHEIKGMYDGRLDFANGQSGKISLRISFEKMADKSLGQFSVKIVDQHGKIQSDVNGNGSSIDVRSTDGSEALFLKVSPYEELQIFQKDSGALIGNYYEREKPGQELKAKGSFLLSRI